MRQPGFRLAAAVGFVLAGIGSAAAFDIPDGQSCGGLVCDLGLFGHKTEPKPAEAAAPLAPAPVAAVGKAETRKLETPRVAHLAKAKVAKVELSKTPVAKPQIAKMTKPVALPVETAMVRPDIVPMAGLAAAAAAEPAAPAVARPTEGMVVLANPYVYTKPQPIQFQSVDPSAGLQ